MIKMDYSAEEITQWFLNDEEVLRRNKYRQAYASQIKLKDIKFPFYKQREEVNRELGKAG